jgi:plastocyanin
VSAAAGSGVATGVARSAALTAELSAVAGTLAACLSDGEARTVALLATEDYLGQLYGGGVPLPREEYLALAADLDPVPTLVRSVRDVERTDDDEATAEVVSVVGNQLLRSRWTFVQAPPSERDDRRTTWRVDAETPLPIDPPAEAAKLEITIEEYAFGPTASTVEGPTLSLAGRNAGAEEHELLVLRLDDGATTADLLREPGPGLPDGVAYVGQVTVPPGDRAEMLLVDLEPGDYAIVCLFPTDRSIPHLALGMEATLTVD